MNQSVSLTITDAQKRKAVALLVFAIQNAEFKSALEDAARLATYSPTVQDQQQARNRLAELFKSANFADVDFSHIVAVAFDYTDRETVGYNDSWRTVGPDGEKLPGADLPDDPSLAALWKQECRVISAHAGGATHT